MALTPEFLSVINMFALHASEDMHRLYLAAVRVAAEHGRVTADDLREVELTNPGRDKRIFGSAIGQLKRKGILIVTGHTSTAKKESHGRPIFAFALTPDWRARWLKDDKLPVPDVLVNLNTPFTDTSKSVPVADLFAALAECHRLATSALTDPLVAGTTTLSRIADLTRDYAQTSSTSPQQPALLPEPPT